MCALATVLIDRTDPSLGTTDLSLVIWPGAGDGQNAGEPPLTGGRSSDREVVPLAVLQGGPGGASSDLLAYYLRRPYPQVFIDQRGTGFGSAAFDCPESGEALPEVLSASGPRALEIELDAYGRCAERLSEHPMLSHTNTANHAADVIDVMTALGHPSWCVYGVSYGTTIALEVSAVSA